MRSRSEIPDELKRDVAKVGSGIANAEPLRDFLKGYVEVAEMDFRLRNAPARFKTKLFRGALRLVNVLVATGEKINPELSPEFLNPLMVEADRIKAMAARTQKTLRIAKKVIEVGRRPFLDGLGSVAENDIIVAWRISTQIRKNKGWRLKQSRLAPVSRNSRRPRRSWRRSPTSTSCALAWERQCLSTCRWRVS